GNAHGRCSLAKRRRVFPGGQRFPSHGNGGVSTRLGIHAECNVAVTVGRGARAERNRIVAANVGVLAARYVAPTVDRCAVAQDVVVVPASDVVVVADDVVIVAEDFRVVVADNGVAASRCGGGITLANDDIAIVAYRVTAAPDEIVV